jgi:WD40 repeat protein
MHLARHGKDQVANLFGNGRSNRQNSECAPTGTQRASWPEPADAVTSVAFAPDGQTAASGSKDMTVKLWSLPAAT